MSGCLILVPPHPATTPDFSRSVARLSGPPQWHQKGLTMSKQQLKRIGLGIVLCGIFVAGVSLGRYVQRARDISYYSYVLMIGEAKKQKGREDYDHYHAVLLDQAFQDLSHTPIWVWRILQKNVTLPDTTQSEFAEVVRQSFSELAARRKVATAAGTEREVLEKAYSY
jgi:hypothetical protein